MNAEDSIKALFNKVIEDHGGNKSAAAASLHTNEVTFWGWVKGSRGLNKALLKAIDQAGARIIFPGRSSAAISRTGANSPIEYIQGQKFVEVPVHGLAQAGYYGSEIFELEPTQFVPILEGYIRPGLRAFEVDGKSMEPTIRKGAFIGVVPFHGDFTEGEMYLIRRPHFGLLVKRVFMGLDSMILKSDNRDFDPLELPYEGYEADTIIMGRVVWILQET